MRKFPTDISCIILSHFLCFLSVSLIVLPFLAFSVNISYFFSHSVTFLFSFSFFLYLSFSHLFSFSRPSYCSHTYSLILIFSHYLILPLILRHFSSSHRLSHPVSLLSFTSFYSPTFSYFLDGFSH